LFFQAPTDLAQDALEADPGENLPQRARLFDHHLVARLAIPRLDRHVAVPVGRRSQHTDTSLPRGVELAAAAPLGDLGTLVFGDDALHLEQQIILRALARRVVEEHQLDPRAAELIHQQRLVGVAPARRSGECTYSRSRAPAATWSRSRSKAGRISVLPLTPSSMK
jgi:hypothetical protein